MNGIRSANNQLHKTMKIKFVKAYMDVAERFSLLSSATRLKVGAIIVKEDRVISIGYNGMPSGWDNECEHWVEDGDIGSGWKTKPEVIHAEANAIAKLAKSPESGKDSVMFLTHSPCIECAKQIYTAGIKKVYYKTAYRNDDGLKFLEKCGIDIEKIIT
jgi:dCMP deaminase